MSAALTLAVVEVEKHVAAGGWDQPPRLYALVETADLLRREPSLAASMDLSSVLPGALTPVEQDDLPPDEPLDETLARIAWPVEVLGCAVVIERYMLPPSAEAELPDEVAASDEESGTSDVGAWVVAHPSREEVRIAVGVLRDGSRESAVRLRAHDADEDVLSGADLVPALAEALAATLAD